MKKMKQCKTCSKEIATSAKVCPGCGAENKKSGKTALCLWAIAFILAVGAVGGSDTDTDNSKEINSEKVESVQEVSQNNSENTIAENKSEDKIDDNIPIEYRPVMEKAQFYSDVVNMSKAKMYEELTAGCGFTAEEAQYAVDNVKVDWKENALKTAKTYEDESISKAGMYDRLTSEYEDMFTEEEAQYAVDNIEVDWKENALEDAKFYQKYMSMSQGEIYDQLTSEFGGQYTAEEAQYAIENLN